MFHVIAGGVIEFDLLQFVNAVPKDQGILPRLCQVSETAALVQTDRPSGKKTRTAGSVPIGMVLPDASVPVQLTGADRWIKNFDVVTVMDRPLPRPADS